MLNWEAVVARNKLTSKENENERELEVDHRMCLVGFQLKKVFHGNERRTL